MTIWQSKAKDAILMEGHMPAKEELPHGIALDLG